MFFTSKHKGPSTPYVWKEGKRVSGTYKEVRYFHGLTREWGEILTRTDGSIEWKYVYYHPFRSLFTSNGSCEQIDIEEEGLPVWFIRYIQRATLDVRDQEETNKHTPS